MEKNNMIHYMEEWPVSAGRVAVCQGLEQGINN